MLRFKTPLPHHMLTLLQVINVIRACLEVQGSQRVELSKQYLLGLVSCMRDLGAVSEVMEAVDDWARVADPSLVRIFIFMVSGAGNGEPECRKRRSVLLCDVWGSEFTTLTLVFAFVWAGGGARFTS